MDYFILVLYASLRGFTMAFSYGYNSFYRNHFVNQTGNLVHFFLESFDIKEFVAKPETYPYSNAHTEASLLKKKTKTNVFPVLSFFEAFILLLPNISGIKKCQVFFATNSNQ